MPKTRHVLNVFLASPNDVIPERNIAVDIVASVNRLAAKYQSWQIDLHKWEDTTPGFGRPQAIINQMVDECDVFIGLLWERWGQPSGKYSSGFEEEYERAKARRKAGNKPEILLVFKSVDPSKLKDPGQQLAKVLAFRETESELHEVLFTNVRDIDDWKSKLHEWLWELILKSSSQEEHRQPPDAVPAFNSPDTSAIESASEIHGGSIPLQLRSVSTLLNKIFQNGTLEFSSTIHNPLQEFDVARLFLFSATLMSHRYTSDTLGTHELNILYKYREKFDLTPTERYQMLRSFVGDKSDVKPGWYWFNDLQDEAVTNALFTLTRDASDDVRVRALGLMATARIKISQELMLELPFEDDSLQVRSSAFNYIATIGDQSELSFLDTIAAEDDSAPVSLIRNAKLQIRTRLEPTKLLSQMIEEDEYISDQQLRSLDGALATIEDHILVLGSKSSWEETRKLALQELMRRGALSITTAEEFTKDPSVKVRAVAFQSLAMQSALPSFDKVRKALTDEEANSKRSLFYGLAALGGVTQDPEPDVDSIIVDFYRTKSVENLRQSINWFRLDGSLAYRALALDHFDSISDILRSDLATGFKRIKEESFQRAVEDGGTEVAEQLSAIFHKYDDFIRSQYEQSALVALSKNPQAADAVLARPYLNHSNSSLQDSAVAIMAKVGNFADVGNLLKIAHESYGTVKKQAASAALALSDTPLSTAQELILSNSAEIAEVGFNWMYMQDSSEIKLLFETLLFEENETNRIRAIYYLSEKMPITELEILLKDYLGRETYYYNVVTWLDRLLYSPFPLKTAFIAELKEKAV